MSTDGLSIGHCTHSSVCRVMAKVLVFLMVLQNCSLLELSRVHQWEPQEFARTMSRLVAAVSPADAEAAVPVADAGTDQAVAKNRPTGSMLPLDAGGSHDPDGENLTYQWYGPFATTTGQCPLVQVPEGEYSVSLTVDDGSSTSPVDTVSVFVTPCFEISARAKTGKVQLTWTHRPGTERYDVYRATGVDASNFVKIGETTSIYSTYLDTTVVNEASFLYVVGAIQNGVTCYSTVVAAYPTASRSGSDHAPLIYSSPIALATVGITYNYHVRAINADQSSPAFALLAAPSGMTIDPVAGLISWVPVQVGSYDVVVQVQDGRGGVATQSFAVVTVSATTPNRAPVADAGPDQTVHVGDTATLDGSRSHDADGDLLTYQWTVDSVPAGSAAALSDATRVNPGLVVDRPGTYRVRLIVNDGQRSSAPDEITVSTENSKPVADAGPDQSARVGDTVTLDGSKSHDVDGDPLAFQWVLTTVPVGSTAHISDSAAVGPTFVLDKQGTYVAQLIVSDGVADSNPGSVTIRTENSTPVADAGADQTAHVGETVTLDGTKSTDVDGDALTFKWALTTVPVGSAAQLSETSVVKPTFLVDKPGTYVAQLIVNDGSTDGAADTVTVLTQNSKPVASAGADQSALVGASVTLDGSQSSDMDGDSLTFKWALIAVPAGSTAQLSEPAAVKPSYSTDKPGTYVVQLIVSDGLADSLPDTVTIITANSRPVANAGPAQSLPVGQMVTLDGSRSSDVDGDPLSFKWAFVSVPAGSAAALSDQAATQPTFIIDRPGNYVAQLIVNDGILDSAPATVTISTQNSKPVAEAGPNQSVFVRDSVSLDGSGSSDADWDPLTYLWSLTAKPAGSSAELSGATVVSPSFTADRQGIYVAQLLVSDGKETSGPDTVTITAQWRMVQVPSLVGMAKAAADAAILSAHLAAGATATDHSQAVAKDHVISQSPAAGTSVQEETSVDLVVSLGPAMVTVPGVVGTDQASARSAILAARLVVGAVTTAHSATVPKNSVISQDPAAGASVPEGSAVSLVLSLGQMVPELVSMAVTPPEMSLASGQTQQCSATGTWSDGTTQDLTTAVSWESTSPAVAAITPSGLARGQDAGTAVIRAVQGTVVGTANVTVLAPAFTAIVVSPASPTLLVGQSQTFTATGVYTDGTSENLTAQVTWSSSNQTAASITAAGVATGLADGAAAVSADKYGISGHTLLSVRARVGESTPPSAAITSPINNSTLTSAVDIVGTANDANFLKYVLEYALVGDGAYTTLATGTTAVVNGVLGRFDTTVLLNDLYTVRLTVFDRNGNTSSASVTYQVTRDQKVGNFTVAFEDLNIPMSGLPITVIRTYDSRDKSKGDFGIGWRLDIQTMKVRANRVQGTGWRVDRTGSFFPNYALVGNDQHKVSITLPDGKVEEFDLTPTPSSSQIYPLQFLTAQYTPRSGTLGTLQALANNNLWILDAQPGPVTLYDDSDFEPYDPQTFQYTSVDGRIVTIDKFAGVQSIQESNGNTLTFSSNGITHSSGKSVSFLRDTHGRITRITDPNGRSNQYAYNSNGDLASHTDPLGNTTCYFYNLSHGLIEIRDPQGTRPIRNEYDESGRLVRHIDAFGKVIEYTHNTNTRQEVVTDRLGRVTVNEYDIAGNVVLTTDPSGAVTSRSYDSRGNILTETNSLGQTRTYTYDSRDNRLTETNPLGQTTTYTFNSRSQVLTTRDPKGNTTTNTYDSRGNPLTTVDPLGNRTTNTYDAKGNLLSTTDPLGQATTCQYDGAGNRIRQTDALGQVTAYTYDANNNQLTETRTRTTDAGPVTMTITKEYDSRNRLVRTIDPLSNTVVTEYNASGKATATLDKNGNRTTYGYDPMGNLVQTTYPDGAFEVTTFDADGNKAAFTDRAGRTTTYEYNATNRLIRTTFSDGSNMALEYDSASRVAATGDENGNRTSFDYDGAGRRTRIVDALGHMTTFTHDANGNEESVTDANGNTTSYVYDAFNRRISIVFPNGTFTSVDFDAKGRKVSETDQAGRRTTYEYDPLDRLVRVTDATAAQTVYSYDEAGNRISQTDANGHTSRWHYDSLGRITRHTLPLGMSESFTYDPKGNLLTRTDFNGNTTSYRYDTLDRLIQKTYADGSQVFYAYTNTGKRMSDQDSRGLTSYSYDQMDRLLQAVNPDGTAIAYTYDPKGNRTSVSVPAGTTTYSFDALNRLQGVRDPDGGETTYTYDSVGNRSSVDYPNGVSSIYTYDNLNRLTGIENRGPAVSLISSYTYTLGPSGNRLIAREDSGRETHYTYDPVYKLIGESVVDPIIGNSNIEYTYDSVGNRLTMTDTSGNISYVYDANDRLITQTGLSNTYIYAYDDNGNTIRKNGGASETRYSYDFENRLVAGHGGVEVTFIYDVDGSKVSTRANNASIHFLVDKNQEYAQVMEERDGSGSLIVSYTFGDDLICQKRNGGTLYYVYDGQMSTRKLTNENGIETDSYAYDAFGVLINRTGSSENRYLYSGEQYDANIGFYYLRARLYSPEIGRFLTPDTFPGSVFEPRSLHKYVYCNANPVDNIDPAGLFGFSIGGLVMVSAIVGILASISAMSYSHYLGRTRAEIAKAGATWFLIGAGVTATVYAVAWGGYLVFIYAATGGITYSQQVYQAFERGQCYVVRLTQDLQVYRWFGGPTGSPTATNPGRWWTPSLFQSSAEAVEYLAVNPAWGNTAEHMATGIIPKGTQILIGYAASQSGFSGGAVQIYTSVVQLLTK